MERKIIKGMFIYFCIIVGFFAAVSIYLYIHKIRYPSDPNDDNEMAGVMIVTFIGVTFIYHLIFLLWSRGLLKQRETFNIYTKLQMAVIFFAGVCLPIYAVLYLFL